MLISFHKGFLMEGEATFLERKHFWNKKKEVGKTALYPHICMKYNKRVYHWGNEPMIHPCPQCEEEKENKQC